MKLLPAFLFTIAAFAGVPNAGEELQYNITWPSGLSLGEGRLKASKAENANWTFELQFDAAVPGFAVADRYTSLTNAETCSLTFDKELSHGKRRTQERITFGDGTATRETIGGGKSTLKIPQCARDALAFVYHLRQEVAAGRIPKSQNVYYGGPYQATLEYGGTQRVKVGDAMENADRIIVNVRGPASELRIEMFVGKDASRTPLVVKVPSTMGEFTLELVR
ncbi:MAG: DUF3108 domain-containing protein [Bryobacteraceae bacterium]|nr:DUF3108 domain-containing protein [Bryobacteraceae bacterium]